MSALATTIERFKNYRRGRGNIRVAWVYTYTVRQVVTDWRCAPFGRMPNGAPCVSSGASDLDQARTLARRTGRAVVELWQ